MTPAYWDAESRRRQKTWGTDPTELVSYLRDEFPHETIGWVTRDALRAGPARQSARKRWAKWFVPAHREDRSGMGAPPPAPSR